MSENKKNPSIKSIIQTGFPSLITFAAVYHASFILIISIVTYISTSILNFSGSSVWVVQSNSDFFLVEHIANLFRIATGIPKTVSNIIIMVILWALLTVTIAIIEAGFYGYTLSTTEHEETTLILSAGDHWKRSLAFMVLFTPFFIFAGLVGFFSELLLSNLGLLSVFSKSISFILMTSILTPFIPARFYFYDGKGFGESLLLSLENIKSYILLTLPPIVIPGIVLIFLVSQIINDVSSVLTIISYSPLLVVFGIFSWFFYGLAISKAGEKYSNLKNLNLPQGGNFD